MVLPSGVATTAVAAVGRPIAVCQLAMVADVDPAHIAVAMDRTTAIAAAVCSVCGTRAAMLVARTGVAVCSPAVLAIQALRPMVIAVMDTPAVVMVDADTVAAVASDAAAIALVATPAADVLFPSSPLHAVLPLPTAVRRCP